MGYKISVLFLLLFAGGAASGQRAICGYFPYGAVHPGQPRLDSFELALYSIKLTGLKEPVLYDDSSKVQTYRFTWLRFFGPAMAVRIERRGTSIKLYWKASKAHEETEPGILIGQGHRTLSMSEWKTFHQMLDSLDFWRCPATTSTTENPTDRVSTWILEGNDHGKYHFVQRATPRAGGAFYGCCLYLLALTEQSIPNEDIY